MLRSLLTRWRAWRDPAFRETLRRNREHARVYRTPPGEKQRLLLRFQVLIIAEATIPQCLKYRVLQKVDLCEQLGIPCHWYSWHDAAACMAALQTHSIVIFYRTPALRSVLAMQEEARRLGLPMIWDVDDLIFDAGMLRKSRSLRQLDRRTFRGLLRGAGLYRQAMLSADATIASTAALATAMAEHGARQPTVLANALDVETLALADRLLASKTSSDGLVRIGYGSGTNTHNVDFLEAAEALVQILRLNPMVRLRLIGELQIPPGLSALSAQIERFSGRDYAGYLELMAGCDISLAPLEPSLFNDCKSNIKYIEASILAIPSVCSPRAEFVRLIQSGRNGFLAEGREAWLSALERLITDGDLRREMGKQARQTVLTEYDPMQLARTQLAPWLATWKPTNPEPAAAKPRLLSVNVYYNPQSFGGATMVAEGLNRQLSQSGWQVGVLTTVPEKLCNGRPLHRYNLDDMPVFGIPIGMFSAETPDVSSETVMQMVELVLDAFEPQIVQLHSIQGIGIDIIELFVRRHIPYVITLHDAWWLCARQFMINRDGRYCEQQTIDPAVCIRCTACPNLVLGRRQRMEQALKGAALLLMPSDFFAELFRANGYSQVIVNRNGINPPLPAPPAAPAPMAANSETPVRFAYVGGNVDIKGFPLVQLVFRRLRRHRNLQLVLVDNTLNLGHASYFGPDLLGLGQLEVVPAYTQSGIDAFYEGVDVLLFPTQWKESFGLAVREALARGVWVITTDAGGVVEDVRDGVNGTILPFDTDVDDLEQAVLGAAELVQAWRRGERVRPRTPVRLLAEQAAELDTLLRKVLSDHSPPVAVQGGRSSPSFGWRASRSSLIPASPD